MSRPAAVRRLAGPAALGLAAAGLLAGCITQEYVRGLGHHTAKGAVEGVGEGLPALQEPLRQMLRQVLVEDDTLRLASRDMTQTAVKTFEEGLASPEVRRQIDGLVARAVDAVARDGSQAVQQLIRTADPEVAALIQRAIQAAEPELREMLRRAAAEGIEIAAARLRERLESDVTPATERLAKRTGEELITSLVKGLEGPLQARLLVAGQEMSQSLIKGLALGLNEPTNQGSFGGLTKLMTREAVRGAREGMHEGLPTERQMALIAAIVVMGALLLFATLGLSFVWWRYHQSTKSLTIMAESINQHRSDELKAAIQQSAHDNYVGPWLSSFLKRRGL